MRNYKDLMILLKDHSSEIYVTNITNIKHYKSLYLGFCDAYNNIIKDIFNYRHFLKDYKIRSPKKFFKKLL